MGNPEYQFSLLFSLFFVLVLFFLSFSHWRLKGAKAFTLLMMLVSFLALCSIFEYRATELDEKIIWRNLQQIPLFFNTIILFYIVTTFLQFSPSKIKRLTAVFSLITSVYLALIMTDGFHGWMRSGIRLEEVGGFVRSGVEPTYLNLLFIAGNTVFVFFTLGLMLIHSIRARRSTRLQHWIIFVSLLFPVVHGIAKELSDSIDVTPMAVSYLLTGLTLFYGLFRYRLMDVWPAAHDIMYENMQDGIITLDASGRIIHVNSKSKKMLALLYPSFENVHAGEEIKDHVRENPKLHELLVSKENKALGITINHPSFIYLHIDRLNVVDQLNKPIGQLWVIKDYTDRKLRENELWKRATEDSLTELMNRQYFFERMEHEINSKEDHEYLSMILLDIDYFKLVNDRYGHYTGDQVLKEFAGILTGNAIDGAFVGRIGGEEFAIFHKVDHPDKSVKLAQKILETTRATKFVSNNHQKFSCTVSLGITVTDHKLASNIFYQMSDDLLYQSKENGRDQLTVEMVFNEKLKEESILK